MVENFRAIKFAATFLRFATGSTQLESEFSVKNNLNYGAHLMKKSPIPPTKTLTKPKRYTNATLNQKKTFEDLHFFKI
jgi:hypothetical protein